MVWYGMAWNEKTGEDCYLSLLFSQTLFKAVLSTIENGGKPVQLNAPTTVGYTKEQAEAIQRLKTAKDNYERLGLTAGASKYKDIVIPVEPHKNLLCPYTWQERPYIETFSLTLSIKPTTLIN